MNWLGLILATSLSFAADELPLELQKEIEKTLSDVDSLGVKIKKFDEELKEVSFPEETPEQIERRLTSLEKRYKVSAHLEKTAPESWPETWEEFQLSNAYLSYRETQNWKRAEEVLQERIKKFPQSNEAVKDYAVFLIERNRLKEAKKVTSEGLRKFPSQPDLRLLSDSLNDLEKSKDDPSRLRVLHEMNQSLLQITQLKLKFASQK
jgi:predicted Zn-dependent protease